MIFNLFQILTLSLLYSLLFAFIDIYFIKWYRNLTKQDKKLTIVLKSIFVVVTGYPLIIKEPYLIPILILTIWLTFDSLMGLYLKNNPFYLGKNSVLDEKGDELDSKLDQNAKLWWFIRLGIILSYIVFYLLIN